VSEWAVGPFGCRKSLETAPERARSNAPPAAAVGFHVAEHENYWALLTSGVWAGSRTGSIFFCVTSLTPR